MKQIKFMLLAISMLLATPALLTSCQEDAPEINYTVTVTVNNDFSKVIEAINNGFLKNEEAIKKLTEAIDKQATSQDNKYQALLEVLNNINTTLETKLIAIEAAMKAQTLSLETKLALLETAVNNQTIKQEELAGKLTTAIDNLNVGMSEKLDAIKGILENAATSLDTKLAAIEAAIKAQTLSLADKLDLLNDAIEALPDYGESLTDISEGLNKLTEAVDQGNIGQAEALQELLKLLEELKQTIANGGATPTETCQLIIDGETISPDRIVIDKNDLDDNQYYFRFYFGPSNTYLEFMADKANHEGKTIDLTQKESSHGGWYWAVVYQKEGYNLFQAYGQPDTSFEVCQSGTLFVKRLADQAGKPVFTVKLENCKVKDDSYGDGEVHIVSLNYEGSFELDEL